MLFRKLAREPASLRVNERKNMGLKSVRVRNFHVAGELSDVESLIVLDLKVGQQQTFKAELFSVSQRPELTTMTITPKGVVSLDE